MPTATTLPLIIMIAFLWRYTKGQMLSCVLFTSVFAAASALNFGRLGVSPWLFTLASCLIFKAIGGHRPYRFTVGVNKIALHLVIIFFIYATFTGFVNPVLFRGVSVMRLGDPEPLAWGLSNIAQLCYLLAAVVLYFIAISSTREELQDAIEWYIRGCVVAALFAMYQLANAIAHVPYPEAVLYSNPSHVIYRAYMINGMWRLNSTFTEASEMAGYLIVGLALLGWSMMKGPLRFGRICCFALMLLSLLLTVSSVGYACLGFMFVAGALLFTRQVIRNRGVSPVKVILTILLVAGVVGLFTLDKDAGKLVNKVVSSTLLEKKNTDSYRERVHTQVAALQTLSDTSYMGAGWGSVRASGLMYVLLATLGVPGLVLFTVFAGTLYIPLFKRRSPSAEAGTDLLGQSLLAITVLLLSFVLAGSEPVDPILWILFGIATVGRLSVSKVGETLLPAFTTSQPRPASVWQPESRKPDASLYPAASGRAPGTLITTRSS